MLDEAMERVPLHKHDPEARFRFAEMRSIEQLSQTELKLYLKGDISDAVTLRKN